MSGLLLGVDVGTSSSKGVLAALVQPDADWSRIVGTVEPDEENRGLYDDLYGVYRELFPATREQMHRLSGMQRGGGDVVV